MRGSRIPLPAAAASEALQTLFVCQRLLWPFLKPSSVENLSLKESFFLALFLSRAEDVTLNKAANFVTC
jgi:hypothetical protein